MKHWALVCPLKSLFHNEYITDGFSNVLSLYARDQRPRSTFFDFEILRN